MYNIIVSENVIEVVNVEFWIRI